MRTPAHDRRKPLSPSKIALDLYNKEATLWCTGVLSTRTRLPRLNRPGPFGNETHNTGGTTVAAVGSVGTIQIQNGSAF